MFRRKDKPPPPKYIMIIMTREPNILWKIDTLVERRQWRLISSEACV